MSPTCDGFTQSFALSRRWWYNLSVEKNSLAANLIADRAPARGVTAPTRGRTAMVHTATPLKEDCPPAAESRCGGYSEPKRNQSSSRISDLNLMLPAVSVNCVVPYLPRLRTC